jgi:hypothetical protein
MNIKTNDVNIQNFNGLRGISAATNIEDKSTVVTVDSSIILETINNRPPTPYPNFCPQSIWEESLWDSRLAFILMYEKFILGASSSRSEWLDQLPKSFSTPIHWNEKELLALQYNELILKIDGQKLLWKNLYQRWKSSMNSDLINKISYEDFEWALECVNSRAFSGVYEGSTFKERKSLLVFTLFLATLWPISGIGSIDQSVVATMVVIFSIFIRDFFSTRYINFF